MSQQPIPAPFSRMASATVTGLLSSADYLKIQGYPAAPLVTSVTNANGLLLSSGVLSLSLAGAGASGAVSSSAQTFEGQKTFTSSIIGSAGAQLGSIWNTNGTGSSDVGVKLGFSTADASVHASAKLLSIRTGIGGTETERFYFTKDLFYLGGGGLWSINPEASSALYVRTGVANIAAFTSSGIFRSAYGFDLNPGFGAFLSFQVQSSGMVNQRGTDSTGTPGAATIDRPTGKSSIAAGASSVIITNNLVTTGTHIVFSQHARDTTCKELIVTAGSGFFTISGNGNATAAIPCSWRIATMLTA